MSRRTVYTIYIDKEIAIPPKFSEKVCFFTDKQKRRTADRIQSWQDTLQFLKEKW